MEIKKIFNILNDMKEKELKSNEFITENDIKELLESKGNRKLLHSPAGSGKTTAIIKYALNNKDNKIALLVPTKALAIDLQAKYKEEKIVFGFQGVNNNYDLDQVNLFIGTYESFYRIKDDLEWTIFIDEVHEFHSFKRISESKRKVLMDIEMSQHDKIDITATGYTLNDNYDYKKNFKKEYSKGLSLVNVESTYKSVLNYSLGLKGNSLIYLNSKKKADKLAKMYEENGIKVETIHSNKLDGNEAFAQIIGDSKVDYDVVITTKILNIGVDIQGKFENLIYANDKVSINDLLQFANRDRQSANFHVLLKNSNDETTINNINKFIESDIKELNKNLTSQEKVLFNRDIYYFNEEIGQMIIDKNMISINKSLKIKWNQELLKNVFEQVFSNIKELKMIDFKDESELKSERMTRGKKVMKFFENFDVNEFTEQFQKDELNENNDYLDLPMDLKYNIRNILRETLDTEKLYPSTVTNEIIEDYINKDKIELISSKYLSDRLKEEEYSNIRIIGLKVNKFFKDGELYKKDKDKLVKYLNKQSLFYNNKKISAKNVGDVLKYVFNIKVDSKVKKIDGKTERVLVNKTIDFNEVSKDIQNRLSNF